MCFPVPMAWLLSGGEQKITEGAWSLIMICTSNDFRFFPENAKTPDFFFLQKEKLLFFPGGGPRGKGGAPAKKKELGKENGTFWDGRAFRVGSVDATLDNNDYYHATRVTQISVGHFRRTCRRPGATRRFIECKLDGDNDPPRLRGRGEQDNTQSTSSGGAPALGILPIPRPALLPAARPGSPMLRGRLFTPTT